jgi:hypothetical protein
MVKNDIPIAVLHNFYLTNLLEDGVQPHVYHDLVWLIEKYWMSFASIHFNWQKSDLLQTIRMKSKIHRASRSGASHERDGGDEMKVMGSVVVQYLQIKMP